MNTEHLYTADFPEEHKVQVVDIILYITKNDLKELDAVVICKDKEVT